MRKSISLELALLALICLPTLALYGCRTAVALSAPIPEFNESDRFSFSPEKTPEPDEIEEAEKKSIPITNVDVDVVRVKPAILQTKPVQSRPVQSRSVQRRGLFRGGRCLFGRCNG